MDSLFEPPQTVVPLGVAGAIGFTVLLLLGASIMIATAVLTRYEVGAGAVVGALLGATLVGAAEHRFFRAVSPDATVSTIVLWVAVLLLPIALAIALALVAEVSAAGALLTAGSGFGAGLLSGATDKLAEHLAAIPLAFGTLAALVMLGVLYFVGDRR